jgi:hypothetical protein
MGEDSANNAHIDALTMLDAFASVGAARFDMTWTNAAGDKDGFRRGVSVGELRRKQPGARTAPASPSSRSATSGPGSSRPSPSPYNLTIEQSGTRYGPSPVYTSYLPQLL